MPELGISPDPGATEHFQPDTNKDELKPTVNELISPKENESKKEQDDFSQEIEEALKYFDQKDEVYSFSEGMKKINEIIGEIDAINFGDETHQHNRSVQAKVNLKLKLGEKLQENNAHLPAWELFINAFKNCDEIKPYRGFEDNSAKNKISLKSSILSECRKNFMNNPLELKKMYLSVFNDGTDKEASDIDYTWKSNAFMMADSKLFSTEELLTLLASTEKPDSDYSLKTELAANEIVYALMRKGKINEAIDIANKTNKINNQHVNLTIIENILGRNHDIEEAFFVLEKFNSARPLEKEAFTEKFWEKIADFFTGIHDVKSILNLLERIKNPNLRNSVIEKTGELLTINGVPEKKIKELEATTLKEKEQFERMISERQKEFAKYKQYLGVATSLLEERISDNYQILWDQEIQKENENPEAYLARMYYNEAKEKPEEGNKSENRELSRKNLEQLIQDVRNLSQQISAELTENKIKELTDGDKEKMIDIWTSKDSKISEFDLIIREISSRFNDLKSSNEGAEISESLHSAFSQLPKSIRKYQGEYYAEILLNLAKTRQIKFNDPKAVKDIYASENLIKDTKPMQFYRSINALLEDVMPEYTHNPLQQTRAKELSEYIFQEINTNQEIKLDDLMEFYLGLLEATSQIPSQESLKKQILEKIFEKADSFKKENHIIIKAFVTLANLGMVKEAKKLLHWEIYTPMSHVFSNLPTSGSENKDDLGYLAIARIYFEDLSNIKEKPETIVLKYQMMGGLADATRHQTDRISTRIKKGIEIN